MPTKKGGSLASNSVSKLVNNAAYSKMNSQATNLTGGCACGKAHASGGKKCETKRGGRNISEFMDQSDNFQIFNKRGGATHLGLDYSSISRTGHMYGNAFARGNTTVANKIMASEGPSVLPSFSSKVATFGATKANSAFTYGTTKSVSVGGAKRENKKKSKK